MSKYNEFEYLDEHPEVVKILMDTAISFSKLSKCAAKKVCCMLYKNGNIISMGLNGTPSGNVNCCDLFKKENGIWKDNKGDILENQNEHHEWSLINEIHAEINALAKAKTDVEGSIAIVTLSPCFNCAKSLVANGIKRIYYNEEYDDITKVKSFLESNNIEVIKIGGNEIE